MSSLCGKARLPQHLDTKHPHLSKAMRHRILKTAPVVKKDTRRVMGLGKDQRSIRSFSIPIQKAPEKESQYAVLAAEKKKTQPFPRFPERRLAEFTKWLSTIDGKLRTPQQAKEITVDVSKCLRFHHSNLSWDHLIDTQKTREYLHLCRDAGVQADGLVTKCDRIVTALTFIKMEKTRPDDYARRATIEAAIERTMSWKRQWRKEKGKGNQYRLARSMEDVTDSTRIITHQPLWDEFDEICSQLENNIPVSEAELKLCTSAAAAVLLYQSLQRPGAVLRLTLEEYGRTSFIPDEGVWVVLVANHKKGPA